MEVADDVEFEILGIEPIAKVRARPDGEQPRQGVGFVIGTVIEHEYEIAVRAKKGNYVLELFDRSPRGPRCGGRGEDPVYAREIVRIDERGSATVKLVTAPLVAIGLRLLPRGGGA